MNYPDGNCPICKKRFKDGDDVVICPQCGAPYHRECYREAGHCVFEAQHGAGFEYSAPSGSSASDSGAASSGARNAGSAAESASRGIRCPACGTVNDAHNIFCEKCGAALRSSGRAQTPPPGAGAFGGGSAFGGVQVNMDGEIDGIPKRDWAAYIGKNAPMYIYRMSQMQMRGAKTSFVISAFFFSPIYFAYRKMWGWAALAMIGTLFFTAIQIVSLAAEAGQPLIGWISADVLGQVSMVGYFVSIGMRFAFGLFAMHLYRKSAGKRIQTLRKEHTDALGYETALAQKGGVSTVGAVVAGVVMFGFVMVVASALGDEVLNYAYAMF